MATRVDPAARERLLRAARAQLAEQARSTGKSVLQVAHDHLDDVVHGVAKATGMDAFGDAEELRKAALAEALSVCQVRTSAAPLPPAEKSFNTLTVQLAEKTTLAADAAPPFTVDAKIARQMSKRGWSPDTMREAVEAPARTVATRDCRHSAGSGVSNDDPATAYFHVSGGYIVRNDLTGAVV